MRAVLISAIGLFERPMVLKASSMCIKNTVAGGAAVSDIIAMLRKIVGLPGPNEDGTIEQSHLMGRIITWQDRSDRESQH